MATVILPGTGRPDQCARRQRRRTSGHADRSCPGRPPRWPAGEPSAEQARAAGLTPAQHQLLLAIRGHPDPAGPTIGEVAQSLLLRHHSTVELVDRAQTAGLVERLADPDDSRVVRLGLTPLGTNRLETLTGTAPGGTGPP